MQMYIRTQMYDDFPIRGVV